MKCPECGYQYSNRAYRCPHCGCPNDVREINRSVEYYQTIFLQNVILLTICTLYVIGEIGSYYMHVLAPIFAIIFCLKGLILYCFQNIWYTYNLLFSLYILPIAALTLLLMLKEVSYTMIVTPEDYNLFIVLSLYPLYRAFIRPVKIINILREYKTNIQDK